MTHSGKGFPVEKTWKALLILCLMLGWLMGGWFDSTFAGETHDSDCRG